jgi:hypothetical protein
LRKLSRREAVLLAALALAVVAVGARLWSRPATAIATDGAARPGSPLLPVPRIDLARLDQARSSDLAGRRDLFDFGHGGVREDDGEPIPTVMVEVPRPGPAAGGVTDPLAPAVVPSPAPPPLSLKYIGSVQNERGVKVAVLVTDKREVLTGQAGDVLANRYRIARIGLESVDLEEIATGQSRRIPLRGGGS